MATNLNFKPRDNNIYANTALAEAEDNRTRYLFAAFLPFKGRHIDLLHLGPMGGYSVNYIPECRIVMIKKHSYLDPNLDANELNQMGGIPVKKGEVGVTREKGIKEQVRDLLGKYGRRGLVELQTPLNIREQNLPDGWTVEFAVGTILDVVLNPNDEEYAEMTREDLLHWYKQTAVERLQFAAENKSVATPRWYQSRADYDLIALPSVLVDHGLELLEELQKSVTVAEVATRNKIKNALDEIEKSRSGKAGRGKLSNLEERAFRWASTPTPIERQMQFEQKQESGFFDKLKDFAQAIRPEPAAAPVVEVLSEEEIERRAEAKAEALFERMLAKMEEKKAAATATEPKVEDTPRGAGGKLTKKQE